MLQQRDQLAAAYESVLCNSIPDNDSPWLDCYLRSVCSAAYGQLCDVRVMLKPTLASTVLSPLAWTPSVSLVGETIFFALLHDLICNSSFVEGQLAFFRSEMERQIEQDEKVHGFHT